MVSALKISIAVIGSRSRRAHRVSHSNPHRVSSPQVQATKPTIFFTANLALKHFPLSRRHHGGVVRAHHQRRQLQYGWWGARAVAKVAPSTCQGTTRGGRSAGTVLC